MWGYVETTFFKVLVQPCNRTQNENYPSFCLWEQADIQLFIFSSQLTKKRPALHARNRDVDANMVEISFIGIADNRLNKYSSDYSFQPSSPNVNFSTVLFPALPRLYISCGFQLISTLWERFVFPECEILVGVR